MSKTLRCCFSRSSRAACAIRYRDDDKSAVNAARRKRQHVLHHGIHVSKAHISFQADEAHLRPRTFSLPKRSIVDKVSFWCGRNKDWHSSLRHPAPSRHVSVTRPGSHVTPSTPVRQLSPRQTSQGPAFQAHVTPTHGTSPPEAHHVTLHVNDGNDVSTRKPQVTLSNVKR